MCACLSKCMFKMFVWKCVCSSHCHQCHACHAKRTLMSPSATPATQSEGRCRQAPCLPCKPTRRQRRQTGTERATRSRSKSAGKFQDATFVPCIFTACSSMYQVEQVGLEVNVSKVCGWPKPAPNFSQRMVYFVKYKIQNMGLVMGSIYMRTCKKTK